jgi:hypothetical protein
MLPAVVPQQPVRPGFENRADAPVLRTGFIREPPTKQFRSPAKPFFRFHDNPLKPGPRYQEGGSTSEGLVMWEIIIDLFYRQSCKKHLTDMRRSLWSTAG